MRDFMIRERQLHPCPEIDCTDESLWPGSPEVENNMSDGKEVILVYFRENARGEKYIDLYFKKVYCQNTYERFIICEGYRLSEEMERLYLEYCRCYFSNDFEWPDDDIVERITTEYPDWHYHKYTDLGSNLEHIYYASHRSGVKEVLYKADLGMIADRIHNFSSLNPEGTTPETIVGLPMKLLRIMNKFQETLSENIIYSPATIDLYKEVYATYGNILGKELPSYSQWLYLVSLYSNNGLFAGRGFNKSLYRLLATRNNKRIVKGYENYCNLLFELKQELPYKRNRLPKPEDIVHELRELEYLKSIKDGKSAYASRIRDDHKPYEFSDEKFCIVAPTTESDICMEAISQHNCLNNYMGKFFDGTITILFLRKTEKPDESYVTIEVDFNSLIQVKGKYNKCPPEEVFCFLEKYCQEKALDYDPFTLIENEPKLKSYLKDYRKKFSWNMSDDETPREDLDQIGIWQLEEMA